MIGLRRTKRATVLLVVLWMIVLLGVVGLSYTAGVRTQVHVAQSARGSSQAYWAARAGVEAARAALMNEDLTQLRADAPLFDDPEMFSKQAVGPAFYSLVAPPGDPEEEELRFGLIDEAARVNVNSAPEEMLRQLPGVDTTMIQSLVDWRDEDEQVLPNGAESDYYMGLEDPYPAGNGALRSVRELMRVRGWRGVFEAAHPDPYAQLMEEEDGEIDPLEAYRLLERITVWSAHPSTAPDGEERMDLAAVSEEEMRRRMSVLSAEEAKAIVKHRESNTFESVMNLFDVREVKEEEDGSQEGRGENNRNKREENGSTNERGRDAERGNEGSAPGDQAQREGNSGQSSPDETRKVFDLKRVGEIIDYFTAGQGSGGRAEGAVNLNTASREVIESIPGMTRAVVDQIVNQRDSGGIAQAGEIAGLSGMNEETFKKIYPHVTAHSTRFRVISRGYDPELDAVATIEAVMAVQTERVEIVYWREY